MKKFILTIACMLTMCGISFAQVSPEQVSIEDNSYSIVVNGDLLTFDKKASANTFCDNAFLIDNKLIFATYEKLPSDKKCGSDQYGYCICRQGKSFLYCFDLETKSLSLMKE